MSETYRKLSVVKVSPNFRESVRVFTQILVPPKDDEILLKNIYAGVNASDVNVTSARYPIDALRLPCDIGFEALGVIEAVGKNVTKFKIGDPGLVFGVPLKGYTEYLYAKAEDVVQVPSVKPEFVALIACGLTASIGLDQSGRIEKGDKVLISSSAGGTGHIAVQWAKQRGCYVIGMTYLTEMESFLKDLGCDRVINYKTEVLDEVLKKEYPEGIDVIWESIGGQVFETLFKHLAPKGRCVVVGSISGFVLSEYSDLFPKYLQKLIEDVVSGKLKIVLDFGKTSAEGEFFGIDSVVRGVEHLNSGRNIGKVVIKIQNE